MAFQSTRWFTEVQNIFVLANKRKQVPSNHDANKLQSFFNCAATLMTSQLQSLALNSLSDFTDLLCRPPVSSQTNVQIKGTVYLISTSSMPLVEYLS